MIQLTDAIILEEGELQWEFVRSGGPGGQNVNKVATAVQLRFDVENSPSLPAEVKERLIRITGRRMTTEGVLIIKAQRNRTQERNRQDALARLKEFIEEASRRPRRRIRTRPGSSSRMQRLESKRREAIKKAKRRMVLHEE